MVCRRIHRQNIPAWAEQHNPSLRCSCYTCVVIIRQSDKCQGYELCRRGLQRGTSDKQAGSQTNGQVISTSSNVVTMHCTTVQWVSCSRYKIFCPDRHSLPTPNVAKNCTALTVEGAIGVIPNKPFYDSIGTSSLNDPHIKKNVCTNRISSSGQPYAVQVCQHLQNFKEGWGKVGHTKEDSKIAKVEPIETASAIYRLNRSKSSRWSDQWLWNAPRRRETSLIVQKKSRLMKAMNTTKKNPSIGYQN